MSELDEQATHENNGVPVDTSDHSLMEVVAAVLLGLAAVAISFSAYQSALWGGVQDTALTGSVLASNKSVDQLQQGDTTRSSDQALFIQWLTLDACVEEADVNAVEPLSPCGQIVGLLSPSGLDAVGVWQGSEDVFPFETEDYEFSIYGEGVDSEEQSNTLFEEAKTANKNGDKYELSSTFLTTVLFFSGISLVVRARKLRIVLIVGSSVILLGAASYMLTLPKTF